MNTTVKKRVARKKAAPKKQLAKVEQKELAAVPQTQTEQVMNSLMASIASGDLAPEQLKMVLDAQERVLDRQAQQEYQIAMVEVQKAMPVIYRNAERDNIEKNYADLDQVVKTVTPIYVEQGFSLSFYTEDSPMNGINNQEVFFVRVACDVMHIGGWLKHLFIDIPYDMTGPQGAKNKTMTHGAGSAFSYGRNYLTKLVFNLATGDDDDGVAAGAVPVDLISETQLADMEALIEEVGSTVEDFTAHCRLESLADMPLTKYKAAIEALKAKGALKQ